MFAALSVIHDVVDYGMRISQSSWVDRRRVVLKEVGRPDPIRGTSDGFAPLGYSIAVELGAVLPSMMGMRGVRTEEEAFTIQKRGFTIRGVR